MARGASGGVREGTTDVREEVQKRVAVDHVEEPVVAVRPSRAAVRRGTRAPPVEEEEQQKRVVGEDGHPEERERPADVGHDAVLDAGDAMRLRCSRPRQLLGVQHARGAGMCACVRTLEVLKGEREDGDDADDLGDVTCRDEREDPPVLVVDDINPQEQNSCSQR